MPKITVPNFFSIRELSPTDRSHLLGVHGIKVVRERRSGKHYRHIWIQGDTKKFLWFVGLDLWWQRYQPRKSFLGRLFFGSWERKETHDRKETLRPQTS